MKVACATLPTNFVPPQSPTKVIRVLGAEGRGCRPNQVWSLSRDNGSVLVWQEDEEGKWALAAILDGHETSAVFGTQVRNGKGEDTGVVVVHTFIQGGEGARG